MDIVELLAGSNYFIFNKTLAKNLSMNCAIIIGLLSNKYSYFKSQNELTIIEGECYFYCTRETIFDEIGMGERCQRDTMKMLQEIGILIVQSHGMPQKNYYRLDSNKILEYLQDTCNDKSLQNVSTDKMLEQDITKYNDKSLQNVTQIINNNTNKLNTNKNILSSSNTSNKTFSNEHIDKLENGEQKKKKEKKKINSLSDLDLGNNKQTKKASPQEISDVVIYLNEKTGSNYKTTTKATENLISSLIVQGFNVEDFKTVIDKKVKEWKGTEMQDYLRPSTLFGDKFEEYLNQTSTFKGKPKTSYSSKPNFDNTASHNVPKGVASMTKEEYAEWEKTLARDENGNYLKF